MYSDRTPPSSTTKCQYLTPWGRILLGFLSAVLIQSHPSLTEPLPTATVRHPQSGRCGRISDWSTNCLEGGLTIRNFIPKTSLKRYIHWSRSMTEKERLMNTIHQYNRPDPHLTALIQHITAGLCVAKWGLSENLQCKKGQNGTTCGPP